MTSLMKMAGLRAHCVCFLSRDVLRNFASGVATPQARIFGFATKISRRLFLLDGEVFFFFFFVFGATADNEHFVIFYLVFPVFLFVIFRSCVFDSLGDIC